MASGFFGGDFDNAKVIHDLNSESGDNSVPPAWTLTAGEIVSDNARFGNNLKTNASGERLFSGSPTTFDDADGKKALYHCYWFTPDLSAVKTLGGIVNSGSSLNRTRLLFFSNRLRVEWNRKTDLGVGLRTIRISSTSGKILINTSHAIVAFIDSGTVGQGKLFIDGVDETASVANINVSSPAGVLQHALLGNHINGLDPGQFVDEFTLIQDDTLSDTKAAALVTQYNDTRGFGYRPKFTGLAVAA